MIQMTEEVEEEEEERMALCVAYLLMPSLHRFPLLIPSHFFPQLSSVTLAIPGKQLPSPLAWLNFQSDPSHSHGHLIIGGYKLAPFQLCLHFSNHYSHCYNKMKQRRRWWKEKRRSTSGGKGRGLGVKWTSIFSLNQVTNCSLFCFFSLFKQFLFLHL